MLVGEAAERWVALVPVAAGLSVPAAAWILLNRTSSHGQSRHWLVSEHCSCASQGGESVGGAGDPVPSPSGWQSWAEVLPCAGAPVTQVLRVLG